MIEQEDKVELTRRRAELVESLATPLSAEDRVRIQGELSVVNAKIQDQGDQYDGRGAAEGKDARTRSGIKAPIPQMTARRYK